MAAITLAAFILVEKAARHPLVDLGQMRTRYAWPLIVVTVLCFASFMLVLGYIVPAIAEDHHVGFSSDGTMTALLFLTPAAAVQLMAAPLIGRLAWVWRSPR